MLRASRLQGLLIASTFLLISASVEAQNTNPPMAAQHPIELITHDDVRVDPYFWLRQRENPEVIAYLEAENRYFESQMAPLSDLQNELFEEIKGRIKQDDATVPYRVGEHLYFSRSEDGKQYPVYARTPLGNPDEEQVLLDVNELAEGHDFYSSRYGASNISPNHKYLAWAADTSGRRFYTVRFLEMSTGESLPDVISNVTGNIAWASDNKTVFYSRQDPETLRWHRIYRHVLGTDQALDVMVYEEADDTFSTFVNRSRDGEFILIGSSQTLSNEYHFLSSDNPSGDFKLFAPRERDHEYSIDHAGGYFYIRSNRGAENFRLMRTPVERTDESNWEEVIAHRSDVFLAGFEVFKNFIVVNERVDGLTRLRIRNWAHPDSEYYIEFDDPAYAVSTGNNPDFNSDVLRFVYESPTTPETTYDFDVESKDRVLLKQKEVLGGFDSAEYQAERIMIPARDGTLVPVTLVYRETLFSRNGTAPLLLYGYGSYGASIQPYFSASRISLLDRGFVYAIAHVRGSQTLGRQWYEDGKLLNKKNSFTDFVDVGNYLAAEGYADKFRMYAMGGSAGGLLMGAVMNLQPDLFDGVIAHVPWVDVVTTMLDDSIPLTTSEYDEWGNPNDPVYYDYMLSYSPYDNVRQTAYPNLLVTTGLHDSQVQYWEPAKWVAKLREMKTDDNLLLMYTNMDAGHGGASGRYDQYRETARDYSFLIHLANRDRQVSPAQ